MNGWNSRARRARRKKVKFELSENDISTFEILDLGNKTVQLLSRQKQLVGLDIGSSAVKAVELRRAKKGFELVHAGLEPLASDTVVDGAIMDALSVADSIAKIFSLHKIKTKNVATSVSGHSVIVKKIPLPAMSEEELEESIQWEAEQHKKERIQAQITFRSTFLT